MTTQYLPDGIPGVVLVFVISQCDVDHNHDSICKIYLSVCYFLVDNLSSGKWFTIRQMTSKQQRCRDVEFINRSNEYNTYSF